MDLQELALPGGFTILLLSAASQLPFFIYLCSYLDGDQSVTIQVKSVCLQHLYSAKIDGLRPGDVPATPDNTALLSLETWHKCSGVCCLLAVCALILRHLGSQGHLYS